MTAVSHPKKGASMARRTLSAAIAIGILLLFAAAPANAAYQYFRMYGAWGSMPPSSPPPQGSTLLLSYSPAPQIEVAVGVTRPASVSGSQGPTSFSVVAGSLPPGLSLDVSSGTISGAPVTAGAYSATVRVSDGISLAQATFATLVVDPFSIRAPFAIAGSGVVTAVVGDQVALTFTGQGGSPPYAMAAETDVPGLSNANGAGLATIMGTFTQAGDYSLGSSGTDASGRSASFGPVAVYVFSPVGLAQSLPDAKQYSGYSASVRATGGRGPYSYVISGLPDGLNALGGNITGTPNVAGPYALSATVKDVDGRTASGSISLNIEPTPPGSFGLPRGPAVAALGQTFSYNFTPIGGIAPYTLALTGDLPPGLSFSGQAISGTPTQEGTYPNLQVTGTDARADTGASQVFTISVVSQVKIASGSASNGVVGQPYSALWRAAGGDGNYTWSISGALPPGLSFDAGGILAGSPTQAGFYDGISVNVTDGAGRTASTGTMAITIRPQGQMTIAGALAKQATVGTAYTASFIAVGGIAPVRYAQVGQWPSWLSLNPATGEAAGTPDSVGTYSGLAVTATDALGTTVTSSSDTITVTLPGFSVTGSLPSTMTVGEPVIDLSHQPVALRVIGGVGTATYSSAGLPPGVNLDPSTGAITGAPTVAGSYVVTALGATDRSGRYASAPGIPTSVTVFEPMAITGSPAPTAVTGTPYSSGFASSGGNGRAIYSVSSGTLPSWLSLNTKSGALGGVPSMADVGTAGPFVVSVTDGIETATSASFSITVVPATASANLSTPTVMRSGSQIAGSLSTNFDAPTWSFNATAILAPALTLTSTSNSFSGVAPAVSNVTKYTVTAAAAENGLSAVAPSFMLTIAGPPAMGNPTSADAVIGHALIDGPSALASNILGNATFDLLRDGAPFDIATACPGLAFNGSIIGGVPSAACSETGLAIRVTDSFDGAQATSGTFSISVTSSLVVTGAPPSGAVGEHYIYTPSVSGGSGSYTFVLADQPGSSLTALGLSFDASTATISGLPSAQGQWQGALTVSDTEGNTTTTNNLVVVIGPALAISPTYGIVGDQATLVVGKPVTGTFSASGGKGVDTFSIASGSLPNGVVLNASGELVGSPAPGSAGSYTVSVAVSDGQATATTDAFELTVLDALAATGQAPSTAVVGQPYFAVFTASGESGSYNWLMTNGPSWLTATPSGPGNNTFTLSGIPTEGDPGRLITITVTDAGRYGDTINVQTYTLMVISTVTIADGPSGTILGSVGQALSTSAPTYASNVGAVSFALLQGGTPVSDLSTRCPGLSFAATSGVISGTPSATCEQTGFTIRVTDAATGKSATSATPFGLSIEQPVVIGSLALPSMIAKETVVSYVPSVSGGTGPYRLAFVGGAGSAGIGSITSGSWNGLSFSSSGISGTPQVGADLTNVTVTATDSRGESSAPVQMNVHVQPELSISPASGPTGTAAIWLEGASPGLYFPGFTAAGGAGNYSYTITGTLPGGVVFIGSSSDPNAGRFVTVPLQAGTFPGLVVTVSDGVRSVSTVPFTLVVESPLAISGSPATTGIAGTPYSATLTVSGESGSYDWTVTGAPSWMTVAQSGAGNQTLTISGTPTGLESDTITISAKDRGTLGDTVTKTLSLSTQLQAMTIAMSQSAYFVLTNNGSTLPAPTVTGLLGTPTYTLLLNGSTSVTSACGLAFDSTTGIISGSVQSTNCNSSFTMKVVDSNGSNATSASFNVSTSIAAPGAQVSAPYGSPINARATAPPPYTGLWAVSNFVGDWVFQTTSSSISPTTAGIYPALTYTASQASDCSTARAANYKVGGVPGGSTQGTCMVYYAAPVPNNAIVTYNITAYNKSGATTATAGSFTIRVTNPFSVNFPSGTLAGTLGTAFTAPLPVVVSAGGSVSWSLQSVGSGCSGVSVTMATGGQVKVTSPSGHCTQSGITVKAVDSYDTSPATGTFSVSF